MATRYLVLLARHQRRRPEQGADGGLARAPRVARPHEGLDVHRQRQRDPELRSIGGHDQAGARGRAPHGLQARQRADRGPGADAGAAPGRRPGPTEGVRRSAGHVPQRRDLPHGDRRADGDEGVRPAPRRRRGVAGQGRDLLAAAERATDEEPPRQDRGHPGLQVDDDPQLADDAWRCSSAWRRPRGSGSARHEIDRATSLRRAAAPRLRGVPVR